MNHKEGIDYFPVKCATDEIYRHFIKVGIVGRHTRMEGCYKWRRCAW